jgi:dihydrofolate synthase/folylpolyglutamate synthase
VISLIELEHTKFLGDTIEAIAGEKAGIIKTGKPLILGKQCEEALEVFRKKTNDKHSELLYFPDIAGISNIKVHPGGTDFSLSFRDNPVSGRPALFPKPLDLSIPIPGSIQAENAGLAVTALKTAFPSIGEDTIRRGLANFNIPARFEKISADPLMIIDGAHTPESAALCAQTFCSLYGDGGILIFGCAADKNALAMAEIFLPHFSQIIITTPGTFKLSEPEKAFEAFANEQSGQEKTLFIADTEEAIRKAVELGRQRKLPVLGAGSFYLAAEIRAAVLNLG